MIDYSVLFHLSGHSASHMHEIWTCCRGQFRMACENFDDNLLSNCLSHWKGNIEDRIFIMFVNMGFTWLLHTRGGSQETCGSLVFSLQVGKVVSQTSTLANVLLLPL